MNEARARPVLVVFPHPDDEVFFCASLRQFIRGGGSVRLVYLTTGRLAPPGRRLRWLSRSLVAADLASIPVEILGFEDGACMSRMTEVRDELRRCMSRLDPRAVFTVAYEGGHPDHDACHWAVVKAADSSPGRPPVYEFPTYHRGGRLFRAGVLLPEAGLVKRTPVREADLRRKAAVLRCHGLHGIALRYFLQLFLDRREFSRGEPYRRVARRSYLDPPHRGRLGYELYTRWRFETFKSTVLRCEG
jgi:LmbE family N-acetylglucosaminyl deacetylase